MNKSVWILLAATFILPACALPPDKARLQGVPVVTYGDTVPKDSDYILFFPAGKPIPTEVAITGNILKDGGTKDSLKVSLQRDIYSYHDWVSFDRQDWKQYKEVLKILLEAKLPGYNNTGPGSIHLSFDTKK